jgi:hypothetical protein
MSWQWSSSIRYYNVNSITTCQCGMQLNLWESTVTARGLGLESRNRSQTIYVACDLSNLNLILNFPSNFLLILRPQAAPVLNYDTSLFYPACCHRASPNNNWSVNRDVAYFLGLDWFAWTRVNCVAASHINAAIVIRV